MPPIPKLDAEKERRMRDMSNNRKSEEKLLELRNTMSVPPSDSGGPAFVSNVEAEGPPRSPVPTDSSHPRVSKAVNDLNLDSPRHGRKSYGGNP
jgi:hypothetical protein